MFEMRDLNTMATRAIVGAIAISQIFTFAI